MNRFNIGICRISIVVSVILMQMFCVSCINDNSSICEEPKQDIQEDGKVYLKFTMITRSDNVNTTRAVDAEGDIVGSNLENEINLSNSSGNPDIKYYLFDDSQNFIQDISPSATTVRETSDYKIYNVVSEIDDEYFDVKLGGTVTFYVLAFANYEGWDVSDITAPQKGTSIETFLSNANNITMTKAPDARLLLRWTDWEYYSGGKYIPMAGLQRFTVPREMLYSTVKPDEDGTGAYDISLATGKYLNMLRSLAKIEIVDKINVGSVYDETVDGMYQWNPDYNYGTGDSDDLKNSWLRIDKVEINGVMSSGSIFPSINQWINSDGNETQQVKLPSIPSGSQYIKPQALTDNYSFDTSTQGQTGNELNLFPDKYATLQRTDKCPVYSGYVFEYNKMLLGSDVTANQQPYVRVTTRGHTSQLSDGSVRVDSESIIFPVRLAEYTNGVATAANNIPYLLRNHIYTFEIGGISQDVNVNWTVCEMDNFNDNITFN